MWSSPFPVQQQHCRDVVRCAPLKRYLQQMVKTFIYVPVVEDLKQHLLIRDGVHQSVGTEQQELVLVPGQLKGIRLGVDIRAKRPGDETFPSISPDPYPILLYHFKYFFSSIRIAPSLFVIWKPL